MGITRTITIIRIIMSGAKSVVQFQIGEFEVAVSIYDDNALVIIHNQIPGVGTIIKTEKYDQIVETDVMIGQQNQYLELLCLELTKLLGFPNMVYILSFKADKLAGFDEIRAILEGFKQHIKVPPKM